MAPILCRTYTKLMPKKNFQHPIVSKLFWNWKLHRRPKRKDDKSTLSTIYIFPSDCQVKIGETTYPRIRIICFPTISCILTPASNLVKFLTQAGKLGCYPKKGLVKARFVLHSPRLTPPLPSLSKPQLQNFLLTRHMTGGANGDFCFCGLDLK